MIFRRANLRSTPFLNEPQDFIEIRFLNLLLTHEHRGVCILIRVCALQTLSLTLNAALANQTQKNG
jgi:hypothetical protein